MEPKTATGLLQDYEIEGEPLPVVGARAAVVDSAGRRVAVIELTEVGVSRLGDVDLGHARDEGEGHDSVAAWRAGHEEYWHGLDYRGWLGDPGEALISAQHDRQTWPGWHSVACGSREIRVADLSSALLADDPAVSARGGR